jgi:hypothetical protein
MARDIIIPRKQLTQRLQLKQQSLKTRLLEQAWYFAPTFSAP